MTTGPVGCRAPSGGVVMRRSAGSPSRRSLASDAAPRTGVSSGSLADPGDRVDHPPRQGADMTGGRDAVRHGPQQCVSDEADVLRLGALLALRDVELDLLALVEG